MSLPIFEETMKQTKLPLTGPLDIQNYDTYLQTAQDEFEKSFNRKFEPQGSLDDFEKVHTLGVGSFGRVMLVRHKQTDKYYAMKLIQKHHLVKTKQIKHTLNEKRILTCIKNPFVLTLEYFFMDNSYLYLTMPFIAGGELFTRLRKSGKFDEAVSRFYAAQMVLCLEYLHYLDLVHRDIKPENILIDHSGYIKLADYGFCKQVKTRTWTICGTPHYMAPEILLSKGYGKAVDWWSFGVLIYELSLGRPPFSGSQPMKIYEKIVASKYVMPNFFTVNLKDLVKNLLQLDLSRRLGNMKNGASDIREHKWFRDIDWMMLFNRKVVPPYIPKYLKPGDVSNFNIHPEEKIQISKNDRFHKEFADF